MVNDTLSATMNNGGTATYYFSVYGSIENNGLVGQIYDDLLVLEVNGSIINKGNWSAYRNYLLFYQNNHSNSVSCFNTGTNSCLFNGSTITGNGASAYSISVSYTHLDVYKRQKYNYCTAFLENMVV